MLVTGSRTSTPASQDVQSGVLLMPNLTPMTSAEAVRPSPVVSASERRLSGGINVDDDDDYHLPRSASHTVCALYSLQLLVFVCLLTESLILAG